MGSDVPHGGQEATPPSAPADEEAIGTDDDALILWMLGLTPDERLAVAQGFADSAVAVRRAGSD